MLSFFPLDVLDEIWDVFESVSERFFSYLPLHQNTGLESGLLCTEDYTGLTVA